ncbi:uncharacterized protein LTR77_010880 [Saxophila tyrrhenica]|uniref:Uncharacterized protein n=1 Tax=Saxophila tyrrhenica TaxID=1690608 RepID=A0AAV9NUW9_9PEZI|nr:hypothetical protein LTR77_010880 [Saxophila tyrrhenica]
MAETKEVKDFTTREIEIMAKAWNCMTEEPKVDYNKLASECNMTNPRSASNAWAAIKKKMFAKSGIDPKAAAAAKKGPKSAAGGDGDDAESGAGTPVKTPRKRGKKAEDEGEGGSPAKKVRGSAKKGKKSEEIVEEGEGEGAVKEEGGEED